jgi:phosphate transport system protein
MSTFAEQLESLSADLISQGDRVESLALEAIDCCFGGDVVAAACVQAQDDEVDRIDVAIERASIQLLQTGTTDPDDIRRVLTIVKVNNELERIADCAVNVSGFAKTSASGEWSLPATFRVMANSAVGMIRDSMRSLRDSDCDLARRVLAFDDTVDAFQEELERDTQQGIADGRYTAAVAFSLLSVTRNLERMADHCTNIAEQVIYLVSGRIVRHLPAQGWSEPELPDC